MRTTHRFLNTGLLSLAVTCFCVSALAADPQKPTEQMQSVLNELKKEGAKPVANLTPQEARKQATPADAAQAVMKNKGIQEDKNAGLARVEDKMIRGAKGLIAARIYTPVGQGPMPMVVYYHGGGFVIADNEVYDASPRALAKQAKAIVVSVDYRKAPEHKFPAAHDDAYAAYQWVMKNAQSLGGDPSKIAVAGESAGGNLAITVSIRARDEGVKIPVHELLIYPVAGTNMNTQSYNENADAKPLGKKDMAWFVKQYTNAPEEKNDPRLNVVGANLKGLPTTTIITAQIDPLRSEGKELADKLKSQGVNVSYKNFDGVTHEFFGMAPVVDEAKEAQQFAVAGLRSAFAG